MLLMCSVDRALAARLPARLEPVDQLPPAHDAARLGNQRREQLALARGQLDAPPVGNHATRARIELDRSAGG